MMGNKDKKFKHLYGTCHAIPKLEEYGARLSSTNSCATALTLTRLSGRLSAVLPARMKMKAGIRGAAKAFIVISIMGLFLLACSNRNSVPAGILSKDQMAKVLTDFYLKEAKINDLHLSQDSALVLFRYFRSQYAKNSSIPDSVIEVSYQYYLSRPKEMGEIFDQMIDSLILREQRANEMVKEAE